MESEEGGGGGAVAVAIAGRAEIDTSAPFRSVKEAVMLFGERVLAGEVYGHRLHEMRAAAERRHELGLARMNSIASELEETRQNLDRAREESLEMANCLTILRKELERTKKELMQLKFLESEKQVTGSDLERLKFIENTKTAINHDHMGEFQKRKCVTFANPPLLARGINLESDQVLERQFSANKGTVPAKKKKKPLIPLIGGLFSKKKGIQEDASPNARRC